MSAPQFKLFASGQNLVAARNQRGVALIVVLLFLVALTGIGLWSARKSTLAESMARNQVDHEVARQAAEAALRDAERDISTAPYGVLQTGAACQRNANTTNDFGMNINDFTLTCATGLCLKEDASYAGSTWPVAVPGTVDTATVEPWWPTSRGGLWNDDATTKPPIKSGACTSFTGGVPYGTYTGVLPIRAVKKQPEYLIEVFNRKHVRMNLDETRVTSTGENANKWSVMYRITARGFGYSEQTQVVLQSVFFP